MGNFEIEQKYRVSDPAAIRKRLRVMKAKKIRSGFESNELLDFRGRLKAKQCVLRLRQYYGEGLLTFKGPRLKGKYKKRLEIELPVDVQKLKQILNLIGFKVAQSYSKEREEYRIGKATVTLDRLRKIGWFVEIEGRPSEIDRISKKLGLTARDMEPRTYLEIVEIARF